MKKEIYVHIPEPCHENWEQMTPVQQGRYCQSCCKRVVDFSQMSDKQILDVLSKASSETCGRFSSEQLERPIVHHTPPVINTYKLFLSAFIPAFLLANSNIAKAQKGKIAVKTEVSENVILGMVLPEISEEVKILGNVKDENGHPLANVAISIKGTQRAAVTNEKGVFFIHVQAGKKQLLEVSHSGYKTKEIEITKDQKKPVEIILSNKDLALTGDVVIVAGNYESREFGEEFDDMFEVSKKINYHGVVVDETGQPIPFASIKMNLNKTAIADSAGRFTFEARQNKKQVSFTASSVGFQPLTSAVELSSKKDTAVEIVLKSKPALAEVFVKCSAAEEITGFAGGLSIVSTVTIRDTANTFIQKVFNNEMFKAYPNPASVGSNLTLAFKKAGKYSIQLFDNSGKLYVQREISNSTSNQTTSFSLPASICSGIYYLKATNTSSYKQFIDKLIIQ